jgi:CxxC motif-containing protein (DUF1111 family)
VRSVSFDHNGQAYSLRLSMLAMVEYQDRSGETIGAAIEAVQRDASDMRRAGRLFWAALQSEATEADAMELMEQIGIARALEMVGQVLAICLEDLTGSKPGSDEGNAPRRATAATSLPNGGGTGSKRGKTPPLSGA